MKNHQTPQWLNNYAFALDLFFSNRLKISRKLLKNLGELNIKMYEKLIINEPNDHYVKYNS